MPKSDRGRFSASKPRPSEARARVKSGQLPTQPSVRSPVHVAHAAFPDEAEIRVARQALDARRVVRACWPATPAPEASRAASPRHLAAASHDRTTVMLPVCPSCCPVPIR